MRIRKEVFMQTVFVIGVIGFMAVEGIALVAQGIRIGRLEERCRRERPARFKGTGRVGR